MTTIPRIRRIAALAVGAALAAATVGFAAAPAGAGTVVDQASEAADPADTFCGACVAGQTFVPSLPVLRSVELAVTSFHGTTTYSTLTVVVRAGGPGGAELGRVSELRSFRFTPSTESWQHFTFTQPVTLTPGETYFLEFTSSNFAGVVWGSEPAADPYPAGTRFDGGAPATGDLFFRTHAEPQAPEPIITDADGDGVDDPDDRCADTDPAAPAPPKWSKNRFWNDADGAFVTSDGTASGWTLADTGGCDGHQIIAAAGLGAGHARHGLSRGELADWVAAG